MKPQRLTLQLGLASHKKWLWFARLHQVASPEAQHYQSILLVKHLILHAQVSLRASIQHRTQDVCKKLYQPGDEASYAATQQG